MGANEEFLEKDFADAYNDIIKEVESLRELAENQRKETQAMQNELNQIIQNQQIEMQVLQSEIKQIAQLLILQSESLNNLHNSNKQIQKDYKNIFGAMEHLYIRSLEGAKFSSEAVWAAIFNNTISNSKWLTNKTFSPGRWAVGYPVLYVMYRILNEMRPKRILELGLGQSTRMIGQYAAAFDDTEHIVVEHDETWIDFFCNDFRFSERSNIVKLDREMIPYKEADNVRVFKGFQETFADKKFDFIFIDAPLGADMKIYARIDTLKMLPKCLNEKFVIMIDDAERSGELNTIAEMENCLKENNIAYRIGRYSGIKDCVVICSEEIGFLTSM